MKIVGLYSFFYTATASTVTTTCQFLTKNMKKEGNFDDKTNDDY